MCGINGIVQLLRGQAPGEGAAAPDEATRIATMNHAIAHRGPDDEGSFFAPGVALGFRRLAIVDLSPAGHQPMLSADGRFVLVFNGEIYNHLELAAELRAAGCVFASRCDAEVILHAYRLWGPACLHRFNGMWAFAIWDRQQQRLFAARDRFGVKPFVYARHQGELFFSSELAGLRAVLPLAEADLTRLHDYLAYGYRRNDGRTWFAGVHELPPAHTLVVHEGRVRIERWWQLGEAPCAVPRAQRAEHLRELLADAVRLRLRSDVPVALLQSGGLDSSAIAALVNDGLGEGARVTAFTAVHPGHAEDESVAVKALMQTCPRLESVLLEPAHEGLAGSLPRFVQAMQEPVFSATGYAHWGLMRAVHERGVKVMLNGQGADEALAGYGHYLTGYRLLDLALSAPWRVPAEAAAMHTRLGASWPMLAAQTTKALLGRNRASAWRGWFGEGGARVLTPAFHAGHRLRPAPGGTADADGAMRLGPHNLRAHLRRQLLADGFNQILHYEDQSSMSWSIEMRSPFVDWRVMEFAMSLPDEDRFDRGVTKKLLREAFAARLPRSIVEQHRKIGFAMPFAAWARGERFRAFLRELVASPEFRGRRIWDAKALGARLLDERAVERGFPLWRFVSTELWLRQTGVTNV